MKNIFYILLFIIYTLLSASSFAQTTIWSENFEGDQSLPEQNKLASGTTLGWANLSITGTENSWWIFDNTRCNVISGNYSLAISQNIPSSSGTMPSYLNGFSSENIAYFTSFIDASNYTNLTIDFKWYCLGDTDNDYAILVYSTDGGVTINDFGVGYYGQSSVQTVTNLNISLLDGTSFLIGYRWVNDNDEHGGNPSFTVDDIIIKGTLCTIDEYRWTGAINTNWGTAGNWCGNTVPTVNDNVIIPTSGITNWPSLNENANCKNLTIEAGAQLSCSSYNLNVYGNWVNYGIFNEGTGSVYFKGSNNSSITVAGQSQEILTEGFESGTTGWTLGSQAGHTEWRRQTGSSHSGSYDCSTYDLLNSTAYSYCNTGVKIYVDLSRNIDLSDYSSASISFSWLCNSTSTTVDNLFSFSGAILKDNMEANAAWDTDTYNLDAYCGNSDNFMFFRMWAGSDVTGTPGFSIDDILITGTPNVETFNNVYFQKSSASFTFNSSINVNGNIEVSSGTLNANGYNISVLGNFTNNSTFVSGTGTIKFIGIATQTISSSSNISYYNFIKNSSSELIFSGNSTSITISNSFNWVDNNDKISVGNANAVSLIINDDLLINMGCEFEINNSSTISIAKNFQNLGSSDLTTGNSTLKFYSSNKSYVLTAPGDTLFYDDFETDPFLGGSSWSFDQGLGRSDWLWTNGQQYAGAYDLAVTDNDGIPYDYQWGSSDYCEAEMILDLTNYTGAILEFWWRCGGDDPDNVDRDGDFGQVFINGVAISTKLWGQQVYTKHSPISLADYCGSTATITFRFQQDGESTPYAQSPGLCIDNVLVYANCIETLNMHNLVVEKDNNSVSTVILCPINVDNDINITKGIFDAAGNNISIEGNWANANETSFLPRGDTVTFIGSVNKTINIGDASFANLFINKPSATLTVNSNVLDVDATVKIFNNSTLISSGNNIEVGGDWINNGTFTHNSNTVIFTGNSNIYTNGTNWGKSFYNVTLNGTSAKLYNDILIGNNFTITAGNWDVSTLNYEMTVYGNWSSTGTFTERNGNVNIRGSNTSVSFAANNGFYNLSLIKSLETDVLTCLSEFKVVNNINMTIGDIDLKTYRIKLNTTGQLVNETNNNRIYSSDGDGVITATRTNPSGNIAGLGCSVSSAVDFGAFEITRGHQMQTNVDGSGSSSILRYFDIKPTVNTALDATLVFSYFENELFGQTEAELELFRFSTEWVNRAGVVNATNKTVTLTGIDAFSRWTLSGKNFPLPINLLYTNVDCENNVAHINWVTSSEINNSFFTVERSTDGVYFENMLEIEGAGNSNDINYYSFVDNELEQNFYYYKIKQTDYDGATSYSSILTSYCNVSTQNTVLNIEYATQSIDVILENTTIGASYIFVIGDIAGKIIIKKSIKAMSNKAVYTINKNTIANGVYYVEFYNSTEKFAQKIIID